MGEWIEITISKEKIDFKKIVSPFMGEWIEIFFVWSRHTRPSVSPFMGEWIEISKSS